MAFFSVFNDNDTDAHLLYSDKILGLKCWGGCFVSVVLITPIGIEGLAIPGESGQNR